VVGAGARGSVIGLYYLSGSEMNDMSTSLNRNVHYWDYLHYHHHNAQALKTQNKPANFESL